MQKVQLPSLTAILGTDPEFFFTSNGQVIGSEKVIPPDKPIQDPRGNKVIRDGVQGEINLAGAHSCRQELAHAIAKALMAAKRFLDDLNAKHPGANLSMDLKSSIVDISDQEWDSLTPDSKILGCMPSLNVYDETATVHAPPDLRMRSAGGHIHLDLKAYNKPFHPDLVRLCDVIIGNTCVLLDRHPRAAERRRYYGRAGEYRLPVYGMEYRTLSNFWLQNYPLTSMVMSLAKLVFTLFYYSERRSPYDPGLYPNFTSDILARFQTEKVREVINSNDLPGAKENLTILQNYLHEVFIYQTRLLPFFLMDHAAMDRLINNGLDHYFGKIDPLRDWLRRAEGSVLGIGVDGWENTFKRI